MRKNYTIEDLILCIAGMCDIPGVPEIKVLTNDKKLIYSFAKQIRNDIGFTDRQLTLAQSKIDDYCNYFQDLDLEKIKQNTLLPIRSIDRSRWIRVIQEDHNYKIGVRFIYSNKLIDALSRVRKKLNETPEYNKEEKVHWFPYNENNLYQIVKAFENKNFELDDTVSTIYNKLCSLKQEDYVPGIYNLKIKNLPDNAKKTLINEVGEISLEKLFLYKERSIKYGLHYFDEHDLNESFKHKSDLVKNISYRTHTNVFADSSKYTIGDLFLSLEELKKFPILIVLEQAKCYDNLISIHNELFNLIDSSETSVMFRLDNHGEGLHFNEYIKTHNLNNKLDKNTKIVYTLENKVSKPLLNSDWKPQSIIVVKNYSVHGIKKILDCYTHNDLIIHYDESVSNRGILLGQKMDNI